MCDHIKNSEGLSAEDAIQHPFVQKNIDLAIHHLKIDMMTHAQLTSANQQNSSVGLIAKWLPREGLGLNGFMSLWRKCILSLPPKAKIHLRKLLQT